MTTIFETSYEKYGTQKITVTIATDRPVSFTGAYHWTRTTEIPSHPQNNRTELSTFVIDKNGVPRWPKVNRVIPADIIKEYFIDQLSYFNKENSDRARDRETRAAVAAYKLAMAGHQPSDEELFEMRAAFGRGSKVVNIITGRQTQL